MKSILPRTSTAKLFKFLSNLSTASQQISAQCHKSLKSSIPSFNKQKIKTGPNREKMYVPVTMSIRLEGGEKKEGGGAGLLERRELDFTKIPTAVPTVDAGGEIGKSRDSRGSGGGERYKDYSVLIFLSTVAAVLPKVVPSVTPEEAKKCFHESRKTGESLVTVAVKEHAEFYAQMMARCGLRSAIEPDGDVL
ncbi:hypothetical protein SUGI_1111890 [Cryptomeria japonica]|nr:hypothetical protein SUGI_1111890 [Cryptomeria japonica]